MIRQFSKYLIIVILVGTFSFFFNIAPVAATTFSFKSPGELGEEGVMTGKIIYDKDAVELALNNPKIKGNSLPLEELGEDREFKFEYISPYSGVKHTEDNICASGFANDINDSVPLDLSRTDKEGPFFQFNSPEDLASFHLTSCVGKLGKVNSSISERDNSVAFSQLQVLFGQARLTDSDYSGMKAGRRYLRKFPLYFKREID